MKKMRLSRLRIKKISSNEGDKKELKENNINSLNERVQLGNEPIEQVNIDDSFEGFSVEKNRIQQTPSIEEVLEKLY